MRKAAIYCLLLCASLQGTAAEMSIQFGPTMISSTASPIAGSEGFAAGIISYAITAPFVASDSASGASSGTLTIGAPGAVFVSMGGVSNPGATGSINSSSSIAPDFTAITGGTWTGVPFAFTMPAHSSITFSTPYTMSYDFGSSVGQVLQQVDIRLGLTQSSASFSGSAGADSKSGVLSLALDNDSDGTASRVFQMHTTFTFSAAPIPEPETYALMLAGLGAMTFALRRSNQG